MPRSLSQRGTLRYSSRRCVRVHKTASARNYMNSMSITTPCWPSIIPHIIPSPTLSWNQHFLYNHWPDWVFAEELRLPLAHGLELAGLEIGDIVPCIFHLIMMLGEGWSRQSLLTHLPIWLHTLSSACANIQHNLWLQYNKLCSASSRALEHLQTATRK